ncbi:MAG: hypothetical protein RL142_932 [Actinomycetota bacterium]|jgi:hypothetical protein
MKLELEYDFAIEQARIFTIISDTNQWPAELEGRILKSQPNERLVAALPDFTRPEFHFHVLRKGTHLVLAHDLIKTEHDLALYEKAWTNWFNELTERLSN